MNYDDHGDNVVKCRCGWIIRRQGKSWTHVGVNSVMCPPKAIWSDPTAFVPDAKAQPVQEATR